MLAWLKSKLLTGVKAAALAEIEKLDRYEDELSALIRKYADPDATAKAVIDWVQKKARELIEKVLP